MSLDSPICNVPATKITEKGYSCTRVGFFYFNIQPDELRAAYALLDKQHQRRAMRVTFNDDYNFIVKYMPGGAHQAASRYFDHLIQSTAQRLSGVPMAHTGFDQMGCTTRQLTDEGRKEPDSCIVPYGIDSPTVVLEVGASETLTQLRGDATRWLESDRFDVRLFILVSIDTPAPNSNTPRITVEHWKALYPPHITRNRGKTAYNAWSADWTFAMSPNYYILLADLFGPAQIPAIYGANTRLTFSVADLAGWRQRIIARY